MIVNLGRRILVNVQVTVSLFSTLNVAVLVERSQVLGIELVPSSQEILDNFHPSKVSSVVEYCPVSTVAEMVSSLVLIVPEGVPVKVNMPSPPTITFLTIIVPCWRVFV